MQPILEAAPKGMGWRWDGVFDASEGGEGEWGHSV